MSKLKKDILTPEEEAAGFNPGEPDDDIFNIKDDEEYLGELPALQDQDKASDEIQDVEEPIQGSAWDSFETSETDATHSEIESDDEETLDSAKVGFELEKEEELHLDKLDIEPSDEVTSADTESYEADEDLKSMLKGELDRSEKRKRKNELIEQEEKELARRAAENHKEVPFEEIDNIKDSTAIDLAIIEADRPSKMFGMDTSLDSDDDLPEQTPKSSKKSQKASTDAKNAKEDIDENVIDENKKISSEEDAKRKKTPFPFVAIIATAVITMLLTVGGFIIYDNYFAGSKSSQELSLTDLELEKNTTIIKEDKTKAKDKVSKADNIEENESGKTAPDTELVQAEAQAPTQKKFDTKKGIVKPIEIAEVKKTPLEKEKLSQQSKKSETIKDRSYSPIKTYEQKESIASDNAASKVAPEAPKAINETQEPDNSLIKQEAIAETFISSNESATRNKIKDEIGLYKVQVYSSLSREDAEDWKKRLENMNIDKVEISSHKIRDKVWYRVRFGEFTTREEARTVASLYGFSQTWIDRVK